MKITKLISGLALVVAAVSQVRGNPQVQWDWSHSGTSGNYSFMANGDMLQQFSPTSYINGLTTDGTWFGSFCIEINEDTVPGVWYDAALSDRADQGGVGSPTPGYDVISVGTAFLYTEFVRGSLSNFNSAFSYNDSTSSGLLNAEIWVLEDELADQNYGGYTSLLIAKFGSLEAAKADYTGSEVRVMNLTSRDEAGNVIYNQDQLVYVPDGGVTAMLLGVGLLGVALARRRL